MNFRRGFFRMWLVAAALWVGAMALLDSNYLWLCGLSAEEQAFVDEEADRILNTRAPPPVVEPKAPGGPGVGAFKDAPTQEQTSPWIDFPNRPFSVLVPDEMTTREEIEQLVLDRFAEQRNAVLLFAFVPPLILLILGVGVGWIARGFSPKTL